MIRPPRAAISISFVVGLGSWTPLAPEWKVISSYMTDPRGQTSPCTPHLAQESLRDRCEHRRISKSSRGTSREMVFFFLLSLFS